MSFIASCPHCQSKFAAQDHLAGKNVRCPKCKVPFRIGDVVGKAQQKAKAEQEQRRKSKTAMDEDLPVARPAKSNPATASPASPNPAKPTPAKPTPAKPSAAKPSAAKPSAAKPAPVKPAPPQSSTAKPAAPSPSATPTRSWKEIAQESQPEPVVSSPAPPVEATPAPAPAPPPHVTPPPEQPIVLSPTMTAAWESLPPIILATARHTVATLPQPSTHPATSHVDREIDILTAIKLPGGASNLDDSLLDQPRMASSQPSIKPADEVIELGFEDLVIEEVEEEVVELTDDDFIDESASPAIEFDPSDDVITEVEIIEEAPRRRSSAALPVGPATAAASIPAPSAANEIGAAPRRRSKSPMMMLVVGGGGFMAVVLLIIAVGLALGGGSAKFEPSDSFSPTSNASQFVDPSGKISVRFPQPFRNTTQIHFGPVRVHGAQLVGKSETFSAYVSDGIPSAKPPSGAKPLREHWLAFNLPELAEPSPAITSIRRHMIGEDYAVEYRLATDIQRHQPGESRVLLIFIQQRMFLLVWSGAEYREDVDSFFASFSIGDEQFGPHGKE